MHRLSYLSHMNTKPTFLRGIHSLWLYSAGPSFGTLVLIGLFLVGCQIVSVSDAQATPVRPIFTRETPSAGTRETIKNQATPVLPPPTRGESPGGTRDVIQPSTPLSLTRATTTPMTGQQVPFHTLASGDQASDFPQRAEIIVRTSEEWSALWQRVHRSVTPVPPMPHVSFTREIVIAVFAGNVGVLAIKVDDVRQIENATVVRIAERLRQPNDIGITAILYPYHIVSIPRTDLPIRFER